MRITQSKIRRRIFFALIGLLAAIGLLLGRVFHITIAANEFYRTRGNAVLVRDLPISAVRGEILDRNGTPLVYTATAATIIVVPRQIKNPKETALRLHAILGGPLKSIEKGLLPGKLTRYIKPYGMRLSEAKARAVRALRMPGIYLVEEGTRTYPFGSMAAQVLGFTGGDGQGLSGIEKQFNKELEGRKGALQFIANARGQEIPNTNDNYVPPVPGLDVELTLDRQIQQFVDREIERVVATYSPDHVTMIVEDPKTGQILAMGNYPSFQPNNWRHVPPDVYNRNLAIWQTFEPGSTFKIVTLAAALQEKKVNLKEKFYDPGYYEVAGHKIRCWKAGGHGSQAYLNVVENSCNPGFVQLGERLGKQSLFSFIRAFGFGKKTGIALPGEGKGILFSPARVGPLELATTAFGQGVSVTPIQQVMAVGAVANGGVLMKPQIVKEFLDPTNGHVQMVNPLAVRRVISTQTASEVRSALESVVAQGTGANAYHEGYRIAGKTGTAQVVEHGRYSGTHYIVSFIGMAPANNPSLVAYVAIDYPRPKGSPVFGGVIAAPVVGRVLADSLQALGVKPQVTGIPKKYRYGIDPVLTVVPSLAGQTYQSAVQAITQSGSILRIAVTGSGPYVIGQAPAAGTKLEQGATVRLMLGPGPQTGGKATGGS